MGGGAWDRAHTTPYGPNIIWGLAHTVNFCKNPLIFVNLCYVSVISIHVFIFCAFDKLPEWRNWLSAVSVKVRYIPLTWTVFVVTVRYVSSTPIKMDRYVPLILIVSINSREYEPTRKDSK